MKVGIGMQGFNPQSGGAHTLETEVLEWIAELAPGHGHSLVALGRDPERPPSLRATGIPYVSIVWPPPVDYKTASGIAQAVSRRLRAGFRRTRPADPVAAAIRMSEPDVMFYPSPFAFLTPEVPYVITVWDVQHRLQPFFPEISRGAAWDRIEALYASSLRRAYAVITGTEVGKAEIVNFYQLGPERVRVLPYPTPSFALDSRGGDDAGTLTKYGLRAGYVFYPAQFWPHKNHVGLLDAITILREEQGLRVPLVLAGSDQGNLEFVIAEAQARGLKDDVHFLGFVPRDDLAALYRHALALVYPTFFGPDNLPPLEAFALGCPVIASAVAGAKEQLGDAAILVDPRDASSLAAAIKRLHDDGDFRIALIALGRTRAATRTGKEFVRGVFAILDEFEPIRRCWRSGVDA